jgi:SAM-dependent methyltransferase
VRVPDLRERWRTGWLEATAYDSVVEHERLTRIFGRLIWGMDGPAFYREIARLRDVPKTARVLDIPCGGGVAFRGLGADQRLKRYVAADLSPIMLRRARNEARRRGLAERIEFVEADVENLPFEDASFDLCVTYPGLHCFPDPAKAIAELARVLAPGGELRGTRVIRNAGVRQDVFVRLMQAGNVFGPGGTIDDLIRWLRDAGLKDVQTRRDGGLAYFSARHSSSQRPAA